jgi:pSer/pThr/pTyr-binding forkhead associated (FHA) protein
LAPSHGPGFALKFISGKYQGGEFPLRSDKEVVIGRSSDLDMVLVEDMVSRKHAKISLAQGKVTLQDLGSTNGTFVNGEKIKRTQLKAGDRILIGTSILKLVAGMSSRTRDMDAKQINEQLEEVAASQPTSGVMSGRIEEVPVPDLLQLFGTSKKNGVLSISGDQEGRIHLRQGRVVFAVIEGASRLGARKAFFRIIAWQTGRFVLEQASEQKLPEELSGSTEALLMEGLRQLDELRRIQPELPPATATLEVVRPLESPLRALAPEQLDVLQTAINHGHLGAVLDLSPLSDRDTCEALLHLLKRDYLRALP